MNKEQPICQQIVLEYQAGNKEIINELPNHIGGLINSLVRPYRYLPDYEDMLQVAWETTMECVNNYEQSKNTLFTTYCYKSIQYKLSQYKRKQDNHRHKYDSDGNLIRSFISMEKPINDSTGVITVADTIEDNSVDLEVKAVMDVLSPIIQELIDDLNNETKKNIIRDYFRGDKSKDIGERYKVSSAYVSMVVKSFYQKCKYELNK